MGRSAGDAAAQCLQQQLRGGGESWSRENAPARLHASAGGAHVEDVDAARAGADAQGKVVGAEACVAWALSSCEAGGRPQMPLGPSSRSAAGAQGHLRSRRRRPRSPAGPGPPAGWQAGKQRPGRQPGGRQGGTLATLAQPLGTPKVRVNLLVLFQSCCPRTLIGCMVVNAPVWSWSVSP